MSLKSTIKGLRKKISTSTKEVSTGFSGVLSKAAKAPSDIKYIKEKNEEIKQLIKETNEKIEPFREEMNKKFEELGKLKTDIYSTTLDEFSKHMKEIENIPFYDKSNESSTANTYCFSPKDLRNLEVTVISMKRVLRNITGVGAAGALSAGAVYSAVAAFGTASTGTLISSISGMAASNATLAWLGGSAVAVGGGGIALGTVVLGGIAIVPTISYLLWKGKLDYTDKREEVDENYKEALAFCAKMNDIIKNFQELNRAIKNTIILINAYNIECIKLNKQTDHIRYNTGINYEKFTDTQKALIQKHITFTSLLLTLINTPIMNEDGSFNTQMMEVLQTSNTFLSKQGDHKHVDFKKKNSLWFYIVSIVLLVGIGAYLYYEYFYKFN